MYSCTKEIDLSISPNQTHFVFGEISNVKSKIFIGDLTNPEVQLISNAKVFIEFAGGHYDFKNNDTIFLLSNVHVPVNVPYVLTVEVGDDINRFYGQLPDTVERAKLELVKLNEFNYEFKLSVEPKIATTEHGFIWGPDYNLYDLIRNGKYGSYANELDFLDRYSDKEFYVARTNPLLFNKDYQVTISRVYREMIDALKQDVIVLENAYNPLYIKYNPAIDVVTDNTIFRVFQVTEIKTNTVRVEDTTPILIECEILNENGEEFIQEIYQNLTFSLEFTDVNDPSMGIPMGESNPTTISQNQLLYAHSFRNNGEDINIADVLNRPIQILIKGEDGNGGGVWALVDFTLTDLAETRKLTIELERE
jgi:hypothetical protein